MIEKNSFYAMAIIGFLCQSTGSTFAADNQDFGSDAETREIAVETEFPEDRQEYVCKACRREYPEVKDESRVSVVASSIGNGLLTTGKFMGRTLKAATGTVVGASLLALTPISFFCKAFLADSATSKIPSFLLRREDAARISMIKNSHILAIPASAFGVFILYKTWQSEPVQEKAVE